MPVYRLARTEELPTIKAFVQLLADHEGRPQDFVATDADLQAAMFGPNPIATVYFAEEEDEICGFAIVYRTFASFAAATSLYIEDLLVHPDFRGRGIGRDFMEFLHAEAGRLGCRRLEWSVLKSNPSAITFYERLGARKIDAWDHYGWDVS